MTPFLQQVARYYVSNHFERLPHLRFFFPNKRAGVFFTHYLREELGDRSIIGPDITTLGDYLYSKQRYTRVQPVVLLFVLYRAYMQVLGGQRYGATEESAEEPYSFDHFYPIGELLLRDFNDIDKHLVDPRLVFENEYQLRELKDDSYLTEAQRELIERHMRVGGKGPLGKQKYRKSYLQFLQHLHEIYEMYRSLLAEQRIAYEGMILRHVCESEESLVEMIDPRMRAVFVGFNVLNPCEHRIFSAFRGSDVGADFYWDYDLPLVRENTLAGYFAQKNMRDFPEPEAGMEHETVSTPPPSVTVYAVPSSVAQTRVVAQLLRERYKEGRVSEDPLSVGIVLPNEQLLVPMLNNISAEVDSVNVTMGYPTKDTSVVALLLMILEMQYSHLASGAHQWRAEEVIDLLSYPMLGQALGEAAEAVVRVLRANRQFYVQSDQLRQMVETASSEDERREVLLALFDTSADESRLALVESLLGVVHLLEEVEEAVGNDLESGLGRQRTSFIPEIAEMLIALKRSLDLWEEMTLTPKVLFRLLGTALRTLRIPFSGEPLEGVQIMGVLESRCLDFETLYIPDAGEGALPQHSSVLGLLTHGIREANGMPTYAWQDRTRSYNFFRLISRAKEVVLIYDSRKNESSTGEVSRYVREMEYLYGVDVRFESASYKLDRLPIPDLRSEIDPDLVAAYRIALRSNAPSEQGLKTSISASKVKDYVKCPRRFYYKEICQIQEESKIDELIEANVLGDLVHGTLCLIYRTASERHPGTGEVDPNILYAYLSAPSRIESVFETVYQRIYNSSLSSTSLTGYSLIQKQVALRMIANVLRKDVDALRSGASLLFVGGEVKIELQHALPGGARINVKGYIDRIDVLDGRIRIVDYKTGRPREESFKEGDPLENLSDEMVQTFFYCMMARRHPDAIPWGAHVDRGLVEQGELFPLIVRPLHSKPDAPFTIRTGKQSALLDSYALILSYFEEEMEGKLEDIAERDNTFPRTEKKTNCKYCPVRDVCIQPLES